MYSCKDDLKTYKGKVLLTSHAPDRPSLSVYNMLSDFERKYMHWFYKKMFDMDEYAFKRADYIIFPCPEAEEPYLHNWPSYKNFRKNNDAKYRYFLTGINKCSAKTSSDDVRNKFNIPKEAFVICYVGRHNEIKGYDLLKDIGSKLLEQENIYFLIAGKEEPMQGLKHPRWIEIGWTNDPHSLINASDIFLLPNKETYFDLVMLEILSLGTIVLASHTGGNKYFEKLQPNGVIQFLGKEDAVKKVLELKKMSQEQKMQLRNLNKKMFAKHFTAEIFTQSYLDLIDSL
jgi:glycosyltransferase involved in cell wall biosynthesis